VSTTELDSDPPAEADRRVFQNICALAERGIVFSRSRRNAQGALVGPSPLLPSDKDGEALARVRVPEHSLTESDRLGARPQEAAETPLINSAARCWRDWHVPGVTAHDGVFQGRHAVISDTIARLQSPTSLSRMLRDPLGFVWRYGLGWQAQSQREEPLTLPPDEFGKLVHELLRRTVGALEPKPGFTVARADEVEAALADAVAIVIKAWPLDRPVPPHVLWVNTVRQAAEMSLAGLCLEKFTEAGTRSWTEVGFGQADNDKGDNRELPWTPSASVAIPGTPVKIRGSIDRIDLRAGGQFLRVTDYKTGGRPRDPATVLIGGGAELQRALYALACRQLLEGSPQIVARLIYLKDKPAIFKLADPDGTFELVSRFVAAACSVLESGKAIPGVGSEAKTNELRLALPASPGYFRRKQTAFRAAAGDLPQFWKAK
jgi:PD-(D/E)XK nuclease superfamily